MPKKNRTFAPFSRTPPPQCIRGNWAWGTHVIRGGYRIWRKVEPNDPRAFMRENLRCHVHFKLTPILMEIYSLSLAVYLHDSTKGDGLQKGGLGPPPPPPPPPYMTLHGYFLAVKKGVLRAKMCMAKIRVWATKRIKVERHPHNPPPLDPALHLTLYQFKDSLARNRTLGDPAS